MDDEVEEAFACFLVIFCGVGWAIPTSLAHWQAFEEASVGGGEDELVAVFDDVSFSVGGGGEVFEFFRQLVVVIGSCLLCGVVCDVVLFDHLF